MCLKYIVIPMTLRDRRERKGTNARQGLNAHRLPRGLGTRVSMWPCAHPDLTHSSAVRPLARARSLKLAPLGSTPISLTTSGTYSNNRRPESGTDERWQRKQVREGARGKKRRGDWEMEGERKEGRGDRREGRRKGSGWQLTRCCVEPREVWTTVPKSALRLSVPR